MAAKVGDFVRTIQHVPTVGTSEFTSGGPDLTVEGVVVEVNRGGTIEVLTRDGDTFTCLNFKELQGFPDNALSPEDLGFACDVRTDMLNKGLMAPPAK